MVMAFDRMVCPCRPTGIDGGARSGAVVVACAGREGGETFSARSNADTLYEYVVCCLRSVSRQLAWVLTAVMPPIEPVLGTVPPSSQFRD